jgi:hypothetical protein
MTTPTSTPTLLKTTAGDGGLSITIAQTGAFGTASSGGDGAIYDPIGAKTAATTTFYSDVAFRIGTSGSRRYLSDLASSVTNVSTNAGNTSTTSRFTISGLQFDLVQSVSNLTKNGTRTGSGLSQVYNITNTSNTAIDFELVRYFDGDLHFDGSLRDRGGKIIRNSQDILFETDGGDDPSAPTTFFCGDYR